MINQKKIFTGGIDADTDPRFIGEHDYLNMENCRVGISKNGKTTRIENIPGTIQITNSYLPSGNNTCIGTAIDEERRRLVYFIYNDAGNHGIFLYDTIAGTVSKLLMNSDVTGGLGFSLTNCIDRNAKVIDNLLYWTNGVGDVWSINIQAALNMQAGLTTFPYYSSPIDSDLLKLIKKAPAYPPTILKSYDSGFVGNFIYNEGFKFCWRFTYIDNETSVLSPYSLLAPLNGANDNYNNVAITLPTAQTIWQTVQKVDLVVIYSSTSVYYIVKTWDKGVSADATAIANHNSGTALTYSFYNNQIGEALDSAYAAKYFEVIPTNVKTLELARNRAFLGNGTYGYDVPKISSLQLYVNTFTTQSYYDGSSIYSNGLISALSYTNAIRYTLTQSVTTTGLPSDFTVTLTYNCYYVDNSFAAYGLKQGYYLLRKVPSAFLVGNNYTYHITMNTTHNYTELIYANTSDVNAVTAFYLKLLMVGNTNTTSGSTPTITAMTTGCIIQSVPPLPNTANRSFCNESSYLASVTFYDKYQRKGGISNALTFKTPFYDSTNVTSNDQFYINALWKLDNTNAVNEIPDWAYYYSVNRSANQTKKSLIQGFSRNVVFYLKNGDGTYTFRTGTNTNTDSILYTDNNTGVAIDISELSVFGLGYTFNKGDEVTLIHSFWYYTGILQDASVWETFEIEGVSGNYILINKFGSNLGAIASNTLMQRGIFTFEIFTPYKASTNEPNYEVADIYPVTNPTLSSRQYSTTSGFINGDAYVIDRINNIKYDSTNVKQQTIGFAQLYKAISPNDLYWQNWYTDAGRANYIDTIGQKALPNRISFSNTYLAGTLTNGLSSFDALNVADTYIEDGAIQKLQLANKQKQEDGAVLLAICFGGTISIYLGETQLVSQTGNAFLGQSSGVIGTMNDLKGSFGTENPESVFTYLGEVYWVDNYNGVMVQYSTNGLFPISSYKMASYFLKALSKYLNTGTRIVSAYDPIAKEVLYVMPAISGVSSNLPSYSDTTPDYATTIQNRFSPYNGNNKTLAFRPAENKWGSAYEFTPEWMEFIDTTLYGFQNGQLWKHNADNSNFNSFYGSNKAQRVMFSVNDNPFDIKDLLTIAVEGKQTPSCAFIYTDYPNEQITDLINTDFTLKEGVWYASVLRDRLSPNTGSSDPNVCLLQGDPIKSATPFVWVEFQVYDEELEVNFVDAGYAVSRGHNNILKK